MGEKGQDAAAAVVKEELLAMLKEKLKAEVDEAALDEIVLSYVVGILEDMTVTTSDDEDDDVDVAAFLEMLSAYLPGAEAIPEAEISVWLRTVAKRLQESAKRENKSTIDISSLICDPKPRTSSTSKPRHASSSSTSSLEFPSSNSEATSSKQPKSRICSESSDNSVDVEEFNQTVSSLVEMFPYACGLEVTHCLSLSGGDVERAAQLIIHRHEQGQAIKPADRKIKLPKVLSDDKDVKDRILGKYGFVDQDEDKRYHRPNLKKNDDKKMIRYRDGKIVSTKGERFTQVSKAESEEMKKSIGLISPANDL